MAVTVASTKAKVNQFFRDSSTNSVSENDRYAAISMAAQQLMTEYGFDQSNLTYELDYFDGLHYYDITTLAPYFLDPVKLSRKVGTTSYLQDKYFSRKEPREIEVEIDTCETTRSFAIEHKDGKTYLIVNFVPQYSKSAIDITSGTWSSDTTNGDATNVEIDDNKLYFDIDVSQSGGDAAIINNSTIPSMDLTKDENVSSWLFKLYLPEVGDITSVSLKWGTDSSNYWLNTTTTDYMGNALSDGENQILLDWASATKVGTPTVSNIPYLSITVSYDNTQGDDEGFWIGELAIARPEQLELTYNSWKIGRSSTGTALTAFTADTDIPFFSGQFDFFENYVAHKAAAILFKQVGLYNDASFEESEAEKEKYALKKNFPTTRIQRTKSFKVGGVNRTIRRRWLR